MTVDSPNSLNKTNSISESRYELYRISEQYLSLYRVLDRETGQVCYMEIPFYLPSLQRYVDLGALLNEQSETVRIFALSRKRQLIHTGSDWVDLQPCPDLFKLQTIISLEPPELSNMSRIIQKPQRHFEAAQTPSQTPYIR
jgi:hypothetical protein